MDLIPKNQEIKNILEKRGMISQKISNEISESWTRCVNNGLDPVVLSEIMKNSSGGNWSLEKYNPYPGVMKTAPASEDYSGGFLNTLMLKDLNLVSELALQSESSTPMGKLALQLYEEMKDQGFGTLDFSSIQKKYL